MVEIISDNQAVRESVQDLIVAIEDQGGFLHPGMVVHCTHGQLSIHAQEVEEGEYLIRIPHDCLVPVREFGWGLAGNKLVIKSTSAKVTPVQNEFANLMVKVFNETDKIASFNRTSLLKAVPEYRDLVSMLFTARDLKTYQAKVFSYDGDDNEYIHYFFGTRCIGLRETVNSTSLISVMMPFLDFMNHHVDGAEYENYLRTAVDDAREYFGIRCRKPVVGSDESFAYYGGIYDAFDIFMIYHYLERETNVVRSVPLHLDMGEIGSITIHSTLTKPVYEQIPEGMADLMLYLPQYETDERSRNVNLGYLLIPGKKAPYALRRVLAPAIWRLHGSVSDHKFERYLAIAEKRVIEENIKFYTGLQDYLDRVTPDQGEEMFVDLVREVASYQMGKIREYPFFETALDFKG